MNFEEFKKHDINMSVSEMCGIASNILWNANAAKCAVIDDTKASMIRAEFAEAMAHLLYANYLEKNIIVAQSALSLPDSESSTDEDTDTFDSDTDASASIGGDSWSLTLKVKGKKNENKKE